MRSFFTQIKAILILVALFTMFIPLCLLVVPFSLQRRLKITCPVWQWGSGIMLRYACEVKIDVSEDYRSPEFRSIPAYGLYVANHQSFIDIPMIITKYQVPPIMKKEVLYIPFVGLLGWICGAMPVSRSQQGSRKRVFIQTKERILNEKIGVQVYPEGTRSKTSHPKTMEEIKRTLMIFAWNEKIPVIPTSVYGTRGVLSPKGAVRPGRHAGIIVHKEIRPEDYPTADDFAVACWGKVIEGYDRMRAQMEPLNKSLSSV